MSAEIQSRYEAATDTYLRECLLAAVRAVLGVPLWMMRYDRDNRQVFVGLTPVTVDTHLAVNDGLAVLGAWLTCSVCGRMTWHQFRSKEHFGALCRLNFRDNKGAYVPDERRTGEATRLCIWCEKGLPTCVIV